MVDGNGNKFISWKVWAGIMGALLTLFVGIALTAIQSNIADAHTKITSLQKDKVDLNRYECDMARIEKKLDILIERNSK